MGRMPAGREYSVPPEALDAAVARALWRTPFGHPKGCRQFPSPCCQLRVTVSRGVYATLSASRAVYTVIKGPIPITHDVHRTCSTKRCIAIDHLVLAPRGSIVTQAHRDNHHAATLKQGAKRRVYTQAVADAMRLMAERGVPIKQAAEQLGIGEGTAQILVRAGGGPRSRRTIPCGTPTNPVCSRCGQQGHWRNRGCPGLAR